MKVPTSMELLDIFDETDSEEWFCLCEQYGAIANGWA